MSSRLRFLIRPALLASAFVILHSSFSAAADPAPKEDARYPFRTDFANENLPWYHPKPGEFPPHHSDRRISGELVSADFIHRTGRFRRSKTGELIDFTMPPYGSVIYLNAEVDLRDVPLGTYFLFFLNQDAQGNFTRLATMEDQYAMDANHGFSYKLDAADLAAGKLMLTKENLAKNQPDAGHQELLVSNETRVWKGDQQIKLGDLAAGDELLFTLDGKDDQGRGHCADLFVGAETHKLVTQRERDKHTAFVKARGLPGWIDRVEGKTLTVTLFSGDPQIFKQTYMGEFTVKKDVFAAVANDELRTYNPGPDESRCQLMEIRKGPEGCYGSSGVTLVLEVKRLLEGDRPGRILRISPSDLRDMPFGEGLYTEMHSAEANELPPKEYPSQFAFRTDYGNETLPWYQLKSGEIPPRWSEHCLSGELVKVDADHRSGQFRADRTGELVDFTLTREGMLIYRNTNRDADNGPERWKSEPASVQYLDAPADLDDLPLGTRCCFHLYQDEKGAFTRAALVEDEFSRLALNKITYRIDALKIRAGKIEVGRQIAPRLDLKAELALPPDIGHTELAVDDATRVWKGAQQVKLGDLAIGDLIVINLTGETMDKPSRCTDIWVGDEVRKMATEQQRKKRGAAVPQHPTSNIQLPPLHHGSRACGTRPRLPMDSVANAKRSGPT